MLRLRPMPMMLLVASFSLAPPGVTNAGGTKVTIVPGPPVPVLIPPPEFIPAPVVPPNGAPAPQITPLPPLVIYTTPLTAVPVPVPPRAQAGRK